MRKPFEDAVATERGWAHPKTGELLVSIRGLPDPVEYYRPNSGPVFSWQPPEDEVVQEISIEKVVEVSLKAIEEVLSEPPNEPLAVDESGKDPFAELVIVSAAKEGRVFTFFLSNITGEPQKAVWSFGEGKSLTRKKGFGDFFDREFTAAGTYDVSVVLTYSDSFKEAATTVTVKE